MNLIYIGKLVNTHGLKGEVKIISDFEYKNDVFSIGNEIIINNTAHKINSYRHHKIFDMVTLSNINSIDDTEKLKGLNVYIDKDKYKFNGYLNSDLIGMDVYDNNKYKGKVVDIYKTDNNDILVIDGIKRHMVPNIKEFVKKVNLEKKQIEIKYIEGLDNEN